MIIAFDLGTGGIKASLYTDELKLLEFFFEEYKTYYPKDNYHEQRPADWWCAVASCTRSLIEKSGVDPASIKAVALSGHSLSGVPIGADGTALLEYVPIWSDGRAVEEAMEFFKVVDQTDWYMTTGNGFPPYYYTLFKLKWMQKHQPEAFAATKTVLGSKDYINYCLTGNMATDHSYLSGCGGYNLKKRAIEQRFFDALKLSADLFPPVMESHEIMGYITKEASALSGLMEGTPVACGGVDNACMALGAVGSGEGKAYISLGTSSWIPVNSAEPVLDPVKKPYVFAHIQENMYTSALSIYAGGNSFRWLRDELGTLGKAKPSYNDLTALADSSVPGAAGVIFNPSLSGGTFLDKSLTIRGAYMNLSLGTKKADIARATLEGITMNLKTAYDFMKEIVGNIDDLVVCGGGSKSPFWMQLFADIFNTTIYKTNVDQDAASLGAAAAAARGIGLIKDYGALNHIVIKERTYLPDAKKAAFYQNWKKAFDKAGELLSDYGDYLQTI